MRLRVWAALAKSCAQSHSDRRWPRDGGEKSRRTVPPSPRPRELAGDKRSVPEPVGQRAAVAHRIGVASNVARLPLEHRPQAELRSTPNDRVAVDQIREAHTEMRHD